MYRLSYDGDNALPASDLYDVVQQGDGRAELTQRPGGDQAAVLRELVEAGVAVTEFTTARVSLEEIFIKVYGEQQTAARV